MTPVEEYRSTGFTVIPGLFNCERIAEIKQNAIRRLTAIDRIDVPSGVNV